MKIAKFEDFHVECGWEVYSFLKISTDEGHPRLGGISASIAGRASARRHPRHGEAADRPGPARIAPNRGPALFLHPHRARRAQPECRRRDPQCLPRHQGQGAGRALSTSCSAARCAPHSGLLVALRRDPGALCGIFRRQGDRQAGGAQGRRISRRPRARRATAATRRSSATSWCSTRRAAASTRRALRAGRAFPNSTCPRTMLDALIAQLSRMREGAGPGSCASRSISTSTTRPRASGASPRRSSRST